MSAIGKEWSQLLRDLEKGFALLRELPPAVTFFGGARITEADPFYQQSREIGCMLAAKGVPPRTGAGPGIMTSVPEGYKSVKPSDERCKTGAFAKGLIEAYADKPEAIPSPRTQGIKIYLPFEPETNHAIDRSVELITFPIRRLMLYENSLALVVFPGGIGTLDELFEVWVRRASGRHQDPIVLYGASFFGPIMAALRQALLEGKRQLVNPVDMDSILVTDDPQEVVAAVTNVEHLVGFDEPPEELARRLMEEIPYVAGALRMARTAITVFGGDALAENDPALCSATRIIDRLADGGKTLRVGTTGAIAKMTFKAFRAANRTDSLQGFFLGDGDDGIPAEWEPSNQLNVSDPLAHKLLLTQNTSGFLALPGGLQTLDEVFSVLCEVQTGKREAAPIVLLGSDYWQPIFEACREVMLSEERQTVSPHDFDLVTIVDSAEDALAALSP